jgi:hypothetical protein
MIRNGIAATIFAAYLAAMSVAVATARPDTPDPPAAIRRMIHRAFGAERAVAECVAWHESRYRTRAISSTGDYGLFQINRETWDPARNPAARRTVGRLDWARILRPEVNVRVAARIWRKHGWRPWATRGWC